MNNQSNNNYDVIRDESKQQLESVDIVFYVGLIIGISLAFISSTTLGIVAILVSAIVAIFLKIYDFSATNKRRLLVQRMQNDLNAKAPNGSTVQVVNRKIKDENGKKIGTIKVFRIKASDSNDIANVTYEDIDDNGENVIKFVPYRQTEQYFDEYHRDDKTRATFDKWVDNINEFRIDDTGVIEPNPYALPELQSIISVLPVKVSNTPQFPNFLNAIYTHLKGLQVSVDTNNSELTWKDSQGNKLLKMNTVSGDLQWNTGKLVDRWEDTTIQDVINELQPTP